MALFGLIGKKAKPNLQPDVPFQQQHQLYFSGGNQGTNLRDLVSKRLFKGEDLGFGPEFVDKATNPAIQASETYFKEKTMPQINSQLSARGLARSAGPNLATDVISKAGRDQNNYVQQLVSQFFTLNEMQKKQDFSESLGVAQNLNNQEERMANARAVASQQLAKDTAGQQNLNASIDRETGNTIMQAAGGFVSGGGFGNVGNLLKGIPGIGGQLNTMLQGVNSVAQPSVKTNTIDNQDDWLSLISDAKRRGLI